MNILIIEDIASSKFGGAERSMRAFCERLAREGHNVHLVFDRFGDYAAPDQSFPYASISRISTLPLRAQSSLAWCRSVWRLLRLCRLHKIDLVFTHVVHAVSMLRILRALCKVRLAIYFKWICGTEFVGRQASWGLRTFDSGAAVSKFVADYWIRNGFPHQKMQIVPEGVEPLTPDDEKIPLGAVSEAWNVCFAGRIVTEKGLHILLESFAYVSKRIPKSFCVVAGAFDEQNGGDAYRTFVMQRIRELGLESRIRFVGYIDPLSTLLRKMDLVVVPSLCQDAQPLVLMQAMAEGVPVLASRIGGIPELLSGQMATHMFEPGNVSELAEKMLDLATYELDRLAPLSRKLKSLIAEKYSLNDVQSQLISTIGIS